MGQQADAGPLATRGRSAPPACRARRHRLRHRRAPAASACARAVCRAARLSVSAVDRRGIAGAVECPAARTSAARIARDRGRHVRITIAIGALAAARAAAAAASSAAAVRLSGMAAASPFTSNVRRSAPWRRARLAVIAAAGTPASARGGDDAPISRSRARRGRRRFGLAARR